MDRQSNDSQEPLAREGFPRWLRVLLVMIGIVMALGFLILIIKASRRGGAAVALAAAAPVAAATLLRRPPKGRQQKRQEIDQAFLQARLRNIGEMEPLMTPAELCHVLNSLFEKGGLAMPFDSPQHMARELKTLGLQSSVRTVPGRSERRWYDLSGYGTHEIPAQ